MKESWKMILERLLLCLGPKMNKIDHNMTGDNNLKFF